MSKNLTKGLPTKEMMKCEGCGEYHPVEDCEVVVIKVVKGKDCKLPSTNHPMSRGQESIEDSYTIEDAKEIGVLKEEVKPVPKPKPGQEARYVVEDQPVKVQGKRPAPLPPGFAGVFIPNGHPDFDSKGAKETRRV